jgi:hypothetical protein
MQDSRKRSDFLIPPKNFWTGFSSVFNLFAVGKKFNASKSPAEADLKALKSDWEMVGEDFITSLRKLNY